MNSSHTHTTIPPPRQPPTKQNLTSAQPVIPRLYMYHFLSPKNLEAFLRILVVVVQNSKKILSLSEEQEDRGGNGYDQEFLGKKTKILWKMRN